MSKPKRERIVFHRSTMVYPPQPNFDMIEMAATAAEVILEQAKPLGMQFLAVMIEVDLKKPSVCPPSAQISATYKFRVDDYYVLLDDLVNLVWAKADPSGP